MSFQGHYIGYGSLEKMLEETDRCGKLYANYIFETSQAQPTQMGMEYCSTLIQVARIDGEIVHYWRWKVAVVLIIASGEPFDPEKSRRARIAGDSAWPGVLSWLNSNASVVEANISMPKNMTYIDGEKPAFLDYETGTARYQLREMVAP